MKKEWKREELNKVRQARKRRGGRKGGTRKDGKKWNM